MGDLLKCNLLFGRSTYSQLSYSEVAQMLASGQVDFTARARGSTSEPYSPLLQYSDFSQFMIHYLKVASHSHSYDSFFNHWYVRGPKVDNFGPFSFLQMLEFFHQDRIGLQTLVRHPSFSGWEPFERSGPFNFKSLEQILKSKSIYNIISRRRHPRISYNTEVFISGCGELYRGTSWTLSSGGIGLITEQQTTFHLNDRLNIILNGNIEHGAIQAKARVVNIKKEHNFERLALEFENPNESLDEYIGKRVPGGESEASQFSVA